jgi:2,4-dienoyl-CoA reductase-like NADH-dependent reductase (Old Yellow Enzyme family)
MPGLLDPLNIAGLHVRNRIVMPPMASGRAGPDGYATKDHVEYHRVRAAAGTGLVIVEHAYVLPIGRFNEGQLGAHDDGTVPGLRNVAAAIRGTGATACLQLSHAGSAGQPAAHGRRPVAPSAVPHPNGKSELPDELGISDIETTVMAFGDAAARAVYAGFEAVEIHAAHGFLLCQFLSPLTNHRTDQYGGSEENRVRLHCDVLREVRRQVGPGVAILLRLGADDEMQGGVTIDMTCRAAPGLIEAGADVLDVSGGLQGSRPTWHSGQGYFVKYAEALKKAAKVPVIAVGGITEPSFADAVVREGRADLVGIGRAMLKDPQWSAWAIQELS